MFPVFKWSVFRSPLYSECVCTCVFSLVRLQLWLCEESFSTIATKKFEIASVTSHVGQQVSSITKFFVTLKKKKITFLVILLRGRPIRPKPNIQINKNHMTKYFLPYDRINRKPDDRIYPHLVTLLRRAIIYLLLHYWEGILSTSCYPIMPIIV